MRKQRWMLPDGVEEILPPHTWAVESLRRHLLDLFRGWGYDLIIPPLIEYLDSLLTGAGQDLDLQTFKLTDQLNGRMMGVRADITPQAARIDAHILGGRGVRRLCYIGAVLHARPDAFGGSRIPLQVGAELFGHSGPESDLEVLRLMIETTGKAAVTDLHLDLGHVGIYRTLVAQTNLSVEQEKALFIILQRKSSHELNDLLTELRIPEAQALWFRGLIDLNGDDRVLDQARLTLANAGNEVIEALDRLTWLVAQLRDHYPDLPVHLDLAELRGYAYHTGVIFALFQPGRGWDLARGGRYDHVGEAFGQARPATGFSTDLVALLNSCGAQADVISMPIRAPALPDQDLRLFIEQLRQSGERVVQILPEQGQESADNSTDRRIVNRQGRWVVE